MPPLTPTNCRICFISCNDNARNASEVVEIYYEATGYEIFKSDTPQKVCEECYDQLMIVKEFRGICECSEKFLEEERQKQEVSATVETETNDVPVKCEENSIEITDDKDEESFEEYLKYEKSNKKRKFFTWNYQKLKDYLEKCNVKLTKELSFILNFAQNHSKVKTAPNQDMTDYQETLCFSENIISCTFCKYTTQHNKTCTSTMQDHCDCLSSHQPLFQCLTKSCTFDTSSLDFLRQHSQIKHNKRLPLLRPLPCDFCRFSCCFESNMIKHRNQHHSEQGIQTCERCQTKFYCEDLKLQHLVFQCYKDYDAGMINAVKLPFEQILQKDWKFGEQSLPSTSRVETENQKETVESDMKYSCDFCFFSTNQLQKLQSHLKSCTKIPNCDVLIEPIDEKVSCDTCGREVKNLENHKRLVHTEKKYECHFCMKRFSQKHALCFHIETVHLNLKKFSCKYCGMAFKHYSSLGMHIGSKHTNHKQICDICGKNFFSPSILAHHRLSHTGELFFFVLKIFLLNFTNNF